MSAVACRYSDDFEMTKAQLESMLRPLTDVERAVVCLRFGLADGHVCSLEETGEMLGIHHESVRTIETQALRKASHTP